MFAGSILLLLTTDILQEYVNTKTLGLWLGDWLHVSFAKCGATLTKCRHHSRRRKKSSLPSKVLNTNNRNESVYENENDSGVEDASDMDSDVEERHVENLIKKYL